MSVGIETRTDGKDILVVSDLHVYYSRGFRRRPLHALCGVSLRVAEGETLAVVGESGSGKSTMGSAILGLFPPSTGTITFQNRDITHVGSAVRRGLGKELQAVFQDPYSSLNPVRTVGQAISEPLLTHRAVPHSQIAGRVAEMLGKVGLPPSAADGYPAEFSGGQRQRIAIARALISEPALVVCDEPVSSLDVSVQAQVLNLLTDLQQTTHCSYLFISHNLTVVRHFARRVLVLYQGMVMEQGLTSEVCERPQHPYTQALLAAVALPDPDVQALRRTGRRESIIRSAQVTGGAVGESQCPFADRCPHVRERCRIERPAERTGRNGVQVACHFFEEFPPVSGLLPQMSTWSMMGAAPKITTTMRPMTDSSASDLREDAS
ncbi:MAG TPA: oligopeptide/dipeptide ABC transporter ATP-binding protein [Ktedonobacterales bacterium]|nr:oligopeptide/dipeptide ABC transporter ATP-binding protein [Ktedonobacterales bacterium]